MLIDCPACARSYHVSSAEIGESGRTVICPRCDAHWFVYGDGTSTLMPSPHDLQIPSFSGRPAVTPFDGTASGLRASLWQAARPVIMGATCLLVAMIALGARQRIVRIEPRLAGLYERIGLAVNVRGLEIAALTPTRPDAVDMTVAGTIRNVAQSRVAVPRLVYEVLDAEGAPLVTWTERAPVKILDTGRTTTFVSSPHQLPPGGHSILVRFATDDDPMPARPSGASRNLDARPRRSCRRSNRASGR